MKYLDVANHINSGRTPEILFTINDLSPSMDITDWLPSRKDGAIQANRKLIAYKQQHHPDDLVGIIGFGARAKLLHAPITVKQGQDRLYHALANAEGDGGTNFTAALRLAESCFLGKPKTSSGSSFLQKLSEFFIESPSLHPMPHISNAVKRIIMLTDGHHNTGGSPVPVATRLKNTGVIIDCIGIGGSPQNVDEALLKQIASVNPDGSIRYCFIGDKHQLIRKYQTLARHIQTI